MDGEHISPLFYLLMWKGGMARMCVTQEFGGRGLGIGGNNSFSILNITGLVWFDFLVDKFEYTSPSKEKGMVGAWGTELIILW